MMRFKREYSCTSAPPDAFMAWTHWLHLYVLTC
jgi:hypothetical protein